MNGSRGGYERLAQAGGRVQNDVLLLEQRQHRLLLRRIEREPPALDVFQELPQQVIAAEVFVARQKVVKRCWPQDGHSTLRQKR